MLTRKHYIAIARAVAQTRRFGGRDKAIQLGKTEWVTGFDSALSHVVYELGTVLKARNSAFDVDRFRAACSDHDAKLE